MYDIFMSVIKNGGYRIGDMLLRIRSYAAAGRLTMDEMAKLETFAREMATVQDGTDMLATLLDHEARLRALEKKHAGEETPPADEDGGPEIPEYVAGRWYYAGDVVMWNGQAYACIAPEGIACVWNPDEYPNHWTAAC